MCVYRNKHIGEITTKKGKKRKKTRGIRKTKVRITASCERAADKVKRRRPSAGFCFLTFMVDTQPDLCLAAVE